MKAKVYDIKTKKVIRMGIYNEGDEDDYGESDRIRDDLEDKKAKAKLHLIALRFAAVRKPGEMT